MPPALQLTIRPIEASDEARWRELWRGYLEYYETVLPDEVYRTTFARLLSGEKNEFSGMLAVLEGEPVGLVHYLFHRSSWDVPNVCYLQDLYTRPDARGQGVARALIEAVYAAADAGSAPHVYWFTQDFNARARRLYDQIGVQTPFIRYNRKPPASGDVVLTPSDVVVRPVTAADEAEWRRLLYGYLDFYETELLEDVFVSTFARVISGDMSEFQALIAEVAGKPVGLAHFLFHRTCWKAENVCYLQDLFVDPAMRGTGVGQALMQGVFAAADAGKAPAVYWLTAESNATARRLYDRIALKTPFIEYDRPS
jgi:GNAT superfamily N-acetyltransferase